jgi:hypothetical protein
LVSVVVPWHLSPRNSRERVTYSIGSDRARDARKVRVLRFILVHARRCETLESVDAWEQEWHDTGRNDGTLLVLYATLNRRFFGGWLPVANVGWTPLPDDDDECRWLGWMRQGSSRALYILLDPHEIDPGDAEKVRKVLLHEMCHVETVGDGHGARWRAAMERLRQQGESWIAENVAMAMLIETRRAVCGDEECIQCRVMVAEAERAYNAATGS